MLSYIIIKNECEFYCWKYGFLTYYKNHPVLNEYWTKKRNSFIARTLAAAEKNDEDLNLYADKNLIS